MAKFLSETGLQTVWSKIDSLFVRKASIVSAPAANSTSPISAGGVYSALEEIEDTVAASENALNTRVTTLENNTVSGSGLTANKLVLGNGGRTVKTSTYGVTTTAPSSSSNDTTIPTSKAVWDAFGSVASALKYKGTVASNSALPATHSVGDVYVVSTAGTFAGKACEVGDYLVCKTAGTSANDAHWDVLNGENQVSNAGASLATAGQSATIATVDGTDLTVTTPSTWTGLTKTGTVTSVTPGTGLRNGTAATAITGSGTLNLISATTDELGGIKAAAVRTATNLSLITGRTATSRYYGVELDGNNKAFVNVPWTSVSDANLKISDGTNTIVAAVVADIGTSATNTTFTVSASQNITATVGGSAGAATLTLTGPDLSSYLTSSSTLDATKLSGTIPSSCYTDTNTDIRFADYFGESTSTAQTTAKTTTNNSKALAAGDLVTGLSAIIYHQYANNATGVTTITLNVGGSGAKAMYNAAGTSRISGSAAAWTAKDIIRWVYDSSLNSNAGGWKLSAVLGNGDSHRFRVLTGGKTPLYSAVTSVTLTSGTGITVSDSGTAITSSGSRTISLASVSGLTAGTYKSVTVDTYGRVTAGTNPTTLSGYGITDAKIASGVITLGSNTITPLTSASTLDATKLSGTIPSSCYTDTNTDIRFADYFGESTTAAGTAAKTTTNNSKALAAGDLVTGLSAIVWHQYANSGSNATLNVGGSGAKAAYNAAGTRISGSTGTWTAKDIIRWVYDSSLNSGSGGWKISAILGNGDSHRFRLLTGGKTALYSGTTLDSISDGSTRKLANYLPLSGGTMAGDITLNGVSVLPLTDATSGATSGLGYLGSSSRRFRAGYIRDIFTSYFNFIDGDTAATLGSINFMSGAAFLRPVDETNSNRFFDYKFYVNSTSNGFFYEEGTGVCVPLGKSDHRWSKVWATDADFSGNFYIGGSIYPSSDITSHLGTSSYRFNSASIVNHYTRNIVFKDQTTGNSCVQFWGGDGYLRVSTGANIDSSKKEIIFHENYGLYPEVGTTTNLGYYSSTDNRFRWANVYAVNGNFSGTIIANGQTVLDESMALTTSEIDTILANAT